jgi:hypothetical protein
VPRYRIRLPSSPVVVKLEVVLLVGFPIWSLRRDFSNVEIRSRVDSKVEQMRKSFKLSPLCLCPCTVVVYSKYTVLFFLRSLSVPSFVANHPSAAVTVIEIVSESHHAARAGGVCADSPLASFSRSRGSDRFNGFCAS